MNDQKLHVVHKTNFLVILLDYNLNFGNDFEEILNSAKDLYVKLFSLKLMNFKLTPPTIIDLYKAFIRSHHFHRIWKSRNLFFKQI